MVCPGDLPEPVCEILEQADGKQYPALMVSYLDKQEGLIYLVHEEAYPELYEQLPALLAYRLKLVKFRREEGAL